MPNNKKIKKKVVVIGAGFGGLQAIKKLSKDENLDITVIDKKTIIYSNLCFIKLRPQF